MEVCKIMKGTDKVDYHSIFPICREDLRGIFLMQTVVGRGKLLSEEAGLKCIYAGICMEKVK